jgi:hypothetical protein
MQMMTIQPLVRRPVHVFVLPAFKEYCEPQRYKPMLHAEHLNDLKHFRSKAKSWEIQKHQLTAATNQVKLSASTLTIKHFQKTFSFQKQSPLQDEQII